MYEKMTMMKKKIVGGPPCLNLAPYKYQYSVDTYNKMFSNIWRPTEIAVAEDLLDYNQTLSNNEKDVVRDSLAMLTTMDMQVADIIGERFIISITAPEVKRTLRMQVFQEGVHQESYQWLIESLILDPDFIYNRHIDVPQIKEKIDFATYMAQTSSKSWEHFCQSYFFFAAVFEGLWFPLGFCPIFGLRRRGLMRRTSEQLQYILRDENLHSQFGLTTLKIIMTETGVFIPDSVFHDILKTSLWYEKNYIEWLLKEPILGHNVEDHVGHFKFVANQCCAAIGISDAFPGAVCSVPWLSEMAELKKEVNFFENRVIEYQVGRKLEW